MTYDQFTKQYSQLLRLTHARLTAHAVQHNLRIVNEEMGAALFLSMGVDTFRAREHALRWFSEHPVNARFRFRFDMSKAAQDIRAKMRAYWEYHRLTGSESAKAAALAFLSSLYVIRSYINEKKAAPIPYLVRKLLSY